jgi:hypothetical protein
MTLHIVLIKIYVCMKLTYNLHKQKNPQGEKGEKYGYFQLTASLEEYFFLPFTLT